MRNTKDSFHARNNLGVTPLPQLRRGNCDDWGVFSDKSGFKDWPELRQTAKDCNDCRTYAVDVEGVERSYCV